MVSNSALPPYDRTLPTLEELHKKFRSLVSLAELTSAINNGGHPTLPSSDPRDYDHYVHEDMLDAIASILVRHEEVVAVAVSGRNVVAMQEQKVAVNTDEPDTVHAEEADHVADGEIDFEGPHYGDIGKARIAAIENLRPEYKKLGFQFPQIMLIEGGKSHLPKIPLSPDGLCKYLLKKMKPHDPLQNHIRTVEDYLARHKKLLDVNARAWDENYFALYLVVQCWRKMFQRIVDWSSQGYIFELGKVPVDKLEPNASYTPRRNRHNHDLARVLLSMDKKDQIRSLIMEPCGKSEWRSERLTNLLSTFTQLEHQNPQHHEMYNLNTCVEFHRLLVATLLAYGKALSTLRDNKKDGASLKHVWYCGGLLREIASSLMLCQHLKACVAWISIPINEKGHLKRYQDYTGFPETGYQNPDVADPGLGNDPEMDLDGSESLDIVFLKWIRLQVNHWLALGTLSRTVGFPSAQDAKLALSLLAVNLPDLARPMEPWQNTVENLISQNLNPTRSYSASDVVEVIAAHIARPPQPGQHPVFKKWNKGYKFIAPIHCEAALASLAKYAHDVSIQHHMQDHTCVAECLQNIDQNAIAVSKRCCPTCWELLDTMEAPNDRFGVRGRHPTVYAVELPPWLPYKVMEDMVNRFERILDTQIFTMMVDKKRRYTRKSSGQSASAASTGSHGHRQPAHIRCDTFASNNNPDEYESSVDSDSTD